MCAKRETFPLFIELLSKADMKVAQLITPQNKLLHINSFLFLRDVVVLISDLIRPQKKRSPNNSFLILRDAVILIPD